MSYRVELATSGRAQCQNTTCKASGEKILKGELRQGVAVTINEHTTMKWRHWGCVTPTVLHNWKDTSGGDMDLVDGYEELPDSAKVKVKRALDSEHVDDDDWKGDVEMNRYNEANPRQGMYSKETKAKEKQKKAGEIEGDADGEEKAPKSKKRSRKDADDEDDDEKPIPKKPRAKKAKAEEDDGDLKAPAKKTKQKATKPKNNATEEADGDGEVDDAPAVKKPRARKPKPSAKVDASSDIEEPLEDELKKPAAKAKKTASKAAKNSDAGPPKLQKKGKSKGKKATVEDDD